MVPAEKSAPLFYLIMPDINTTTPAYSPMQTVKRRFFAMRNGVIADVLRRAGSPFRIIFGLNLPQIVDIARQTGKDGQLGRELWANSTTRESKLLAPMLMDPADFLENEARLWLNDIMCVEVADVLCHRLLRHVPYALSLADDLAVSDNAMLRYVGARLMMNLVGAAPSKASEIARKIQSQPHALTDRLAAMLAEEAEFYLAEQK